VGENEGERLLAVAILTSLSLDLKEGSKHNPELPAQAFVITFPLLLRTKRGILCMHYHRL
jgi:hypothetical protein